MCHGNICRSPFAAALLARGLERCVPPVHIASAGFLEPGRQSPLEAQAVAARWGVDLSRHRSSLLSPEQVQSADLIVVMEPAQRRALHDRFGRSLPDVLVLGDVDPRRIVARPIPDPIGEPAAAYERSYGRIARCIGVLAAVLRRLHGPSDWSARAIQAPRRMAGPSASDTASTTPGPQSSTVNSS